jgi:hypothetical protein
MKNVVLKKISLVFLNIGIYFGIKNGNRKFNKLKIANLRKRFCGLSL